MRVFHLISHFDLGGAEKVALNICKSPTKAFEYHLVEVARGNSDFTDKMIREMIENGIHYHRAPVSSPKLGIILFPLWFFFLYLRYRPKVIHTHTEVPDLSIYLWHFLFPFHKNIVRTIHNTELWNDWKFIGKKVELFFQKYQCNVAISQSTQNLYVSNFGGTRPSIIYNGLEICNQIPFPQLKKDKINVLFAGRLEYQKGIDQLVGVVSALKDDERYFFHIVGNGAMKDRIDQLMESCNNIAYYSKIYGLASYLGSFDYLFMPSNFEGLPLLSIEASLAKTPTISSDCEGLHETLPEDWSLKVADNDVRSYVNLFHCIDVSSYEEQANQAYNYAFRHFSIKQMQNAYERLYHTILTNN